MSAPSRIGLIGDVHCEDQSLALAIETLHAAGFETIVCTGDVATGPGRINNCCDLLRRYNITTVRGNHDRWLLNHMANVSPLATTLGSLTKSSWRFLESLPVTIDVPTSEGPALLCHGVGAEDMLSIEPEQSDSELDDHPILDSIVKSQRYRWIINGHSHRRMVRPYQSLTIINAGTLRRDHDPCFAAIDLEQRIATFWDIRDQVTAVRTSEIAMRY
ncbi:MAG TPA: metallophosphoesterase family protein [Schlesneria sp.]|jgi:predicted phosphodiesterase